MNKVAQGPFKIVKEVNQALGLPLDYTGVITWCNYMHLIKSVLLNTSVYVVKNIPIKLCLSSLLILPIIRQKNFLRVEQFVTNWESI